MMWVTDAQLLGAALAVSSFTLGMIAHRALLLLGFWEPDPAHAVEPLPRVCRRCGMRFSGEAMLYCLNEDPLCSNAIWAEPGVRAQGPDWHLGGRPL